MKKYQIRFNTNSTSDEDRWRLISENKEILVSDIVVNGCVYTSKDWVKDVNDYKWHITCIGDCVIENNIAIIKTHKSESSIERHILKTITYRLLGTTATFVSAYIVSDSFELASILGFGELIFKPLLYFIHERLWYKYVRIKK
jgi:uncharacterized membrane protein